jgi:hypothetical protein
MNIFFSSCWIFFVSTQNPNEIIPPDSRYCVCSAETPNVLNVKYKGF